ncbi:hypothetical protein ASPCAL03179 [Aspergillus calidoustus]|uniref:Uncharacterized protein n=1 Tax=Aspergillus calidoustus TaxID=454130 RepID=A0A0U5GMH0_ASPCI|nr:hypothetical protein ASPCAL03179 [Aspergillus calidoustus]
MVPNCVTMAYNGERHAFRNNALLFRALMSPARMSAKTDPTSSLCRYFDSAVTEFRSFTLFMDRITRVTLHAFWGGPHSMWELPNLPLSPCPKSGASPPCI